MCEITLKNDYIDVPLHSVQLVPPTPDLTVEIFNGDHAGRVGKVKTMFGTDIVVEFDDDDVVRIDRQSVFVLK